MPEAAESFGAGKQHSDAYSSALQPSSQHVETYSRHDERRDHPDYCLPLSSATHARRSREGGGQGAQHATPFQLASNLQEIQRDC